MRIVKLAPILLTLILAFAACGGDDDNNDDASGSPTSASSTASATEGADETPEATARPTTSSSSSGTSIPSDRVWTLEEAQALLTTLPITPADLPSKWKINSDTTQDNAAAATADPVAGASFERCGRLLSRLVVNGPDQADLVARYVGGESVAFFSTFTVYATDAGAADCATEAAARFSQCVELAKAFGSVFIDPAAVSCVPFEYPQTADGSFAVGLTGKISAQGTVVDLTIKIVAFRLGNVSGVVGAAAAFDPLVEEISPLVDTAVERINAARS